MLFLLILSFDLYTLIDISAGIQIDFSLFSERNRSSQYFEKFSKRAKISQKCKLLTCQSRFKSSEKSTWINVNYNFPIKVSYSVGILQLV